jgi:hypothetical protein
VGYGLPRVAAWLLDRYTHNVNADWRISAADARIKLKSRYPALELIQATCPQSPSVDRTEDAAA